MKNTIDEITKRIISAIFIIIPLFCVNTLITNASYDDNLNKEEIEAQYDVSDDDVIVHQKKLGGKIEVYNTYDRDIEYYEKHAVGKAYNHGYFYLENGILPYSDIHDLDVDIQLPNGLSFNEFFSSRKKSIHVDPHNYSDNYIEIFIMPNAPYVQSFNILTKYKISDTGEEDTYEYSIPVNYNEEKVFLKDKDAWGFANSKESYAYSDPYYYPLDRFKEVYGLSYASLCKNSSSELYRSIHRPFGGNCYGMTVTSIMIFGQEINWDDYFIKNSKNETPNEYGTYGTDDSSWYRVCEPEVCKLIERYQLLQPSDEIQTSERSTKYYAKNLPEYNSYKNYMAYFINYINTRNTIPLALILDFPNGRHAVVLQNAKKIDATKNEWVRLDIYDPNFPFLCDDINDEAPNNLYKKNYYDCDWYGYIEINPTSGKCRFPTNVYEQYVGDEWVATPENFYVYDILGSGLSNRFDYVNDWRGSILKALLFLSNNSSIEINSNNENILECDNGIVKSCSTDVNVRKEIGISLDNNITNTQIDLPIDKMDIKYVSGEDISIFGNKKVQSINLCDG